jgi:hypothetical protein
MPSSKNETWRPMTMSADLIVMGARADLAPKRRLPIFRGRMTKIGHVLWRLVAPSQPPLDLDELVFLADHAAEKQDWRSLVKYAAQARQLVPSSAELCEMHACGLAHLGHTAEALNLYGEAHNLGHPEAALCAARLCSDIADMETAAHYLVLALDAHPEKLLPEIERDDDLMALQDRPDVAAALRRAHKGAQRNRRHLNRQGHPARRSSHALRS